MAGTGKFQEPLFRSPIHLFQHFYRFILESKMELIFTIFQIHA